MVVVPKIAKMDMIRNSRWPFYIYKKKLSNNFFSRTTGPFWLIFAGSIRGTSLFSLNLSGRIENRHSMDGVNLGKLRKISDTLIF